MTDTQTPPDQNAPQVSARTAERSTRTDTVVIKIGSALLANTDLLTPRFGFMQRLFEDIARLKADGRNVILCSSGAVALGLRTVGETPETAGVSDKQAAAACGMPLLLNAYRQVGLEYGLEIAQVLLTLGDFEDHRRFLNTRNTVNRLLEAAVVPIVNENDSITTEEIRVGDNDRLAAKVAQMASARDLVILTGVEGLYDRHPDDPDAQLVEVVHDVAPYIAATKGKSALGTGGMETKLVAANMAQEAGCTTWIADGEVEAPVSSVLSGERRCTRCVAHENPSSGWESWIANRLQMAGSLVVSDALAGRLGEAGASIMRESVLSVDGDFTRGDVLHIYDERGLELARGLSDFTSEEIRVLHHNPATKAEQLLGYRSKGEIVRAKNLVPLKARHLRWSAPDSRA